jgi:ribonuclease P protein component
LPGAADRGANASPWSNPAPGSRRRYPRTCRLLHRAEFDRVYREGQRRSTKQFVVFYRPNGGAESRFGSSVKRALGTAVERNRMRRRIREIARLGRQEIAPGWDIVIHPRRTVATADFAALQQELLTLLKQALA